jgi:hypothetical protein
MPHVATSKTFPAPGAILVMVDQMFAGPPGYIPALYEVGPVWMN